MMGEAWTQLRIHYKKMLSVVVIVSMLWYVHRHENERMVLQQRAHIDSITERFEDMERMHAVDRAMRVRDTQFVDDNRDAAKIEAPSTRVDPSKYLLSLSPAFQKLAITQAALERRNSVPSDCSMIFSINTGRTGSAYLAHVLSFDTAELNVFHEAQPDMSASVLRDVKEYGLKSTYHARFMKKAPAIRRALEGGRIYVETSHLFIKSFYDIVMKEFVEKRQCTVRVIVLRRNAEDIAFSLDRLKFDRQLGDWYYTPGDEISALNPLPMKDTKERIAGYLYDIEAQIDRFRRTYPNVSMIEVELEQIVHAQGVRRLYSALDLNADALPANDAVLQSKLKVVNMKGSLKPGVYASTPEEAIEIRARIIDDLLKFRQRYTALYGEQSIPRLPSIG